MEVQTETLYQFLFYQAIDGRQQWHRLISSAYFFSYCSGCRIAGYSTLALSSRLDLRSD